MNFTDDLYTIINKNEKSIEILLSNEKHPIFCAHFPNMPILPGFLQIDIAQELFNIKIKKIKKTKFLNIIKPNNQIIFSQIKNKILIKDLEDKKISEIIYE